MKKELWIFLILILLVPVPGYSADTKISGFTDGSGSVAGTDYLAGYTTGPANRRFTITSILGLLSGTYQPADADLDTWAAITPGTGIGTALAINTGSAGAPVLYDGALGTPSSGVGTNITGSASGLSAGGLTGTPDITVDVVTHNGLLPACLTSAPGTPSNGQLACADGDNWQPGGATQGTNDWLVRYKSDGTTWVGIYDLTAGADIVSSSLTITTTGNIATSGNLTGIVPSVVLTHASGVHDGSSNVATLSDSGESFTTNAMVGMTLYNVTDASSCTVTANNGTTITCTLAGGTDNDWDASDAWQVGPGPNQSGSVFYVGLASTIRHPATAGYAAAYMSTTTGVVTVEVADAMTLTYCTAAAVDAGDTIDSPATAGSLTWIHNQSATIGACHGQRNTWTDGGAT